LYALWLLFHRRAANPYLSAGTILTDVGSVKAPVEAIAPFGPFVGGHPMAGKADSGIEAAVADLFALKPYVLTPVATTPEQAVKTVEKIAKSLGSTVYHSNDHDRAVSWVLIYQSYQCWVDCRLYEEN